MRTSVLLAMLSGALAVCFTSCGPQAGDATLTVKATPRTIDLTSGTASVSVQAIDGFNKPGTGTVNITSAAGSLAGGAQVQLTADGTGSVDFTCAGDVACKGSVKVTAAWTPANPKGSAEVNASTSVTVTSVPDAGSSDGGVDAGSRFDAGVTDGGFFNNYIITASAPKTVLLEGTSDTVTITATLLTNTANQVPAVGRVITFTASSGASFSTSAPQPTTTVVSDGTGSASATLNVAAATRGNLLVTVAGEDAQATVQLRIVKVQSMVQVDVMTATSLAIKSTGQGFSTQVGFQIKDPDGVPIQGVTVSFALAANAPAGCSIAPTTDKTDALGTVKTLLTSGDAQGTVAVTATVLGYTPVTSAGITINIGLPSDAKLQVTCARKTLGALETTTPPRTDQSTLCTAGFTDRNGVRVPFATKVSWATEAGQIDTVSTAAANSGFATATFTTNGGLPVSTNPQPGEPTNGEKNPRDMFVTIIAAVDGEEEFWDGSGGGEKNGKWDPGEWYVDLGEPFVDSNDDGVWSPGEPFLDSEHVDCVTGAVIPPNQKWDPPNGCWDAHTKIWRSAHVVYSDGLVDSPSTSYIEFSPPLPTGQPPPPPLVLLNETKIWGVNWYDPYFNRLSNDSPSISFVVLSGMRGQLTVTADLGGEAFGHDLIYPTYRAGPLPSGGFTYPDGGFGYVKEGLCDVANFPADAGQSKCIRTYEFAAWKTSPTHFTLTATDPSPQMPLSDGGIPGPTRTTYQLQGKNALLSGPSTYALPIDYQ